VSWVSVQSLRKAHLDLKVPDNVAVAVDKAEGVDKAAVRAFRDQRVLRLDRAIRATSLAIQLVVKRY